MSQFSAQELIDQLNVFQRKAVETDEGALLILAGPGTGKTRVMAAKILNALAKGIAPSSVLAVTFSKRATAELEDRLAHSSPMIAEEVQVSTLHSFCVELVQRHGFRLGFQRQPAMMSDGQTRIFFRQLASQLPLQPFLKTAQVEPVMESLLSLFQEMKDQGLWPEDVLKFAENLSQESEDDKNLRSEWIAIGDLYNAYQSHCFEHGYLDFGDAVLCALRLLKDHSVFRQEQHQQWKLILVDEFQDTNWTQIELLRYLAGPETHIAAVGDDDQSIYKFRGASYSAFEFFKTAFPTAQTLELKQTYRFTPQILEVATTLIRANGDHRFHPNKELQAHRPSGDPVNVVVSSSFEDEARFCCDQVEEFLKAGVLTSEIGILARAHRHFDLVIEEAKRRNLPLIATGSECVFENPIVEDILSYFRLVQNPHDTLAFFRLLDSPFLRLSAEEIFKFIISFRERQPFWDNFEDKISKIDIRDESRERLRIFFNAFRESVAKASRWRSSEILLHLYESTQTFQSNAINENDRKALARFHSELQSWERVQPEKNLRRLAPLLDAISRHEFTLDPEESVERDPSEVSCMTVHASKGLEFEKVIILSLVGRRFPSQMRKPVWQIPNDMRREAGITSESHTEEERRLLYVAMTRAKTGLYLSAVNKPGTKPSRFLIEDLKSIRSNSQILHWTERPKAETTSLPTQHHPQPFSRVEPMNVSVDKKRESLSLSFTQLDKYERCPRAYEYEYVWRIPTRPSLSLVIGSAAHEALEKLFREVQRDQILDKESFLEFYASSIAQIAREQDLEVPEAVKASSHERLGKYYDSYQGNFPKPLAVEESFCLSIPPHQIRGKIDRVDSRDGGAWIVDYKTGKGKSSDSSDDRKFAKESLQLSIYALAAKEIFRWPLKGLTLEYIDAGVSLHAERTDTDLQNAKSKIMEFSEGIQNARFEPTPGFHCRYCEFKGICPSADRSSS